MRKKLLLTKRLVFQRLLALMFLFFGLTGLLSAQIAQRGTATTATSNNSSVTLSTPTGVQPGDVMIANIGNYVNSGQTNASCAGWIVIAGTDTDRGRATLLYKIVTASEPATHVFSVTNPSDRSIGAIVAFSGVNTLNPFDVTLPGSWTVVGSDVINNIPSITTQFSSSAVLVFGNASRLPNTTTANSNFTSWTLTNPASLTELYDVGTTGANNMVALSAAWGIRSTAGATGNAGFTCTPNTNPRNMGGIMIALRPAQTISTMDAQICQNFNTLSNSGTASALPNGWSISETGANANSTYTAGTGSSGTGDTYSLGTAANTDRALGGLLTGNLTPSYGAQFFNNTSTTISNFDISYLGETWRVGAANRSDRLDFAYSTNATSLTSGTWVDVNSLDYSNPGQATANGSLLHSATITSTISGLSIAPGTSFWIRWTDFDATGSDDAMGVDDVCITPVTPICIPVVSIASNDVDNSICNGTSVTFTATPTNGGTAPSYQWKLNGANVGTNSATYTNVSLADGDIVQVVMTSNAACASPTTATSNSIATGVTPNPSLPLTSSVGNTICEGTAVTFTASGASQYQFFVDGVSQGAASATSTFNTSALTNGQVVSVQSTGATVIPSNGTPFVLDGTMEANWGSALATSAGGPAPGFGAGHELNALYASANQNNLFVGVAGNVQSGNRILVWIDSKTGGYTNGNYGRASAPQGVDDINSGISFDAGFAADYVLVIGVASGQYFYDLYTLSGTAGSGGGPNQYLGYTNAPSAPFTQFNLGAAMGANPANSNNTRGFEIQIPKSLLDYTTGSVQLFAMYTAENGFLSNQFLTRANGGDGNYTNTNTNFGAANPNPVAMSTITCPATGSITMTVNPNATIALTSAGSTNNQTPCAGNAITNITYSIAGGATGATVTGLPSGVSANVASGVVTISGTPTVTGVFNYTVTTTGTCTQTTASGSITIGQITYANLQFPATGSVCSNGTYNVFGRVYAAGLTEAAGANANVEAQFGYHTTNTDPSTWTNWSAATWNVQSNNDDEYSAAFNTTLAAGTYYYTFRYRIFGCVWVYGGYSVSGGGIWNGTSNVNGQVLLNANNTIALTSAAGTNAQTSCINTAITNITYATTGATGATVSGLPAGVSGTWASNVFTIGGTPTASGTFNYTVIMTGGCTGGTNTATGSITVSANNTIALTSAVATANQTQNAGFAITNITYSTTTATGASVSGLPSGVTGTWAANVFTISGTPTSTGTFNYTVTMTGGCTGGTNTATGTITVNANAVSLTAMDIQSCENFNTLPTTGTSSVLPVGWYLSETGTNANATHTVGTGSSNVGDTYNLGAAGNADRALGGLLSSTLVPSYGAQYVNNTGNTISILTISYTGETWRVGSAGRSDRIDFQYSTDATSLSTGSWMDENALDYSNPGQPTGSGSIQHTANISFTIKNLSLAPGASIWIRWTDLDVTGNDDAMGVDNVCVTPVTPCTPSVAIVSNDADNTFCAGTSVTFTATPTNGGGAPSYQWKLNGNNVGTNSATYSNSALANNDQVSVVLTSNALCALPVTASSNLITNTVITNVTNVTIGSSVSSVLGSASWNFTTAAPVATPANVVVSNVTVGNSNNTGLMLSNTNPSSGYTGASAGNNIALGDEGTALTTGAGGNAYFEFTITPNSGYWFSINSIGFGSRSSGANNGPTDISVRSSADNYASDIYTAGINDNSVWEYISTPVNSALASGSSAITIRVYGFGGNANTNNVNWRVDDLLLGLTINSLTTGNSNTFCSGTTPFFVAAPTNGGTNPSYQWRVNGTNVGTNSSTYFNPTLNDNDVVTVIMTSNATCPFPAAVTSAPVTVDIQTSLLTTTGISNCGSGNLTVSATSSCNVPGSSISWFASATGGTALATGSTYTANYSASSNVYAQENFIGGETVYASDNTGTANRGLQFTLYTDITLNSVNIQSDGNANITIQLWNATTAAPIVVNGNTYSITVPVVTGDNLETLGWYIPAGVGYRLVVTNMDGRNLTRTPNFTFPESLPGVGIITGNVDTGGNNRYNIFYNWNYSTTRVPATVTITPIANAGTLSGNQSLCSNGTVTFTSNGDAGGTWTSDNISVATINSSTGLITPVVVGTATITYSVAGSNGCASATATRTVNVTAPITPSVAVTSNDADNSICSGTSVTFTAAPTNGGTTPAYQWKLNGTNVGTDATTYTNTALANNDVVTVVLTANNACQSSATANGNNITTAVINNVTPTVVITSSDADNSICQGTSVTFTATPTNGGTTPAYQWKLNGTNVGTDATTYTNASLANNDVVTVVLTANNTCQTSATADGNNITTTVINNVTPSVAITSSDADNSICSGTSVTFTATPTSGGTTLSYQWKLNGTNVGTDATTYTNASLANNDVVTVVLTANNTCQTSATADGNNITTAVINNVTPSVAITSSDADNSICSGTSVTFTAAPTNGGTTPSYQWKLNGINVGTDATTYTNASLANNDLVTVVLTANNTCQTSATANGNNITTTVINNVTPSVAVTSNDADNSICSGTSVTFTATPTNGGATPSYQWKLNGTNVGTDATTYSNASLANNDVVTVVLTANNICQTASTANGNTIATTVINYVTPSVSIVANNAVICPGAGNVVTFTATPTNGGTLPTYQWKVNGSNVGTNSTVFSSSTLSGGDNIKVDMLANNQCQTIGMASSSSIAITALTVYNYYQDIDGDGYGNPSTGVSDCTSPNGYVMDNTDCLDNNGDVYPDGFEICNGIDDNCNGESDEDVELTTYYLDNDGDGFGGATGSIQSCDIPAGYIQIGGDCNDNNANVRPTAQELCSTNFDDDCDGLINEICFPGNDNPNFASNCPLSTSTTFCNTVTGNLQSATATSTFGSGTLSNNPDVWFYFTANAVGMTIRCTPSINDVGLELRTSSGELLKTMNAVSAVGDEYMNYDDLTIGHQYYLRVMNMNGSAQGGGFTLCARRIVPTSSAFNYTNVYVYNTGCTNVIPTNLSTFTNTTISLTPVGGGTEYTAAGPVAQLGSFLSATGNGINYNTVYNGKVTFGSAYPIGGGSTELLTFTTNMTNTLNVLPVVDLDLSTNYLCPRTWSVGTMIRADRWICGAVKYQWRFEQYLNGQPYLVNGNPVVIEQYGINGSRDIFTLAAYGFVPGSEWRVKVRPVFPNNVHGDYGTDEQCLRFKGALAAAPLMDEDESDSISLGSKITLYPNPSRHGEINLMNDEWSEATVTMHILDATGKVVLERVFSESALIQENANQLANGMYLIQLSWGNQSAQMHWILQR